MQARQDSTMGEQLQSSIQKAKKEIELLEVEIADQRKILTAFDKLEADSKLEVNNLEEAKEDAEKKIHKAKNDLVNTENDLEKKKEQIRDNDAKIITLEQGGQVEDQATSLQKALNAAKNDLNRILAQIKSINDEIKRQNRELDQN